MIAITQDSSPRPSIATSPARNAKSDDDAECKAGPLREAPHRVAFHRVELELGVRHHKIGPLHERRVGERPHGNRSAHDAPNMLEIGNEQDGCGETSIAKTAPRRREEKDIAEVAREVKRASCFLCHLNCGVLCTKKTAES